MDEIDYIKQFKQDWIDRYICNFMATYDANHLLIGSDRSQLLYKPCKYEWAKEQADRAWIEYLKGIKND